MIYVAPTVPNLQTEKKVLSVTAVFHVYRWASVAAFPYCYFSFGFCNFCSSVSKGTFLRYCDVVRLICSYTWCKLSVCILVRPPTSFDLNWKIKQAVTCAERVCQPHLLPRLLGAQSVPGAASRRCDLNDSDKFSCGIQTFINLQKSVFQAAVCVGDLTSSGDDALCWWVSVIDGQKDRQNKATVIANKYISPLQALLQMADKARVFHTVCETVWTASSLMDTSGWSE